MTCVPRRGDTFLIDSGPGKHLFVLLNDHAGGPHLLVSVTTWKPHAKSNDGTCVITTGDHPRVRHTSYIYYRVPMECDTAKLQRFVDAGYFARKEPVSDALLVRICAGVLTSAQTPKWAKTLWSRLSKPPLSGLPGIS